MYHEHRSLGGYRVLTGSTLHTSVDYDGGIPFVNISSVHMIIKYCCGL